MSLSYPALKCVLENLEAVKRLHIAARSPVLQKFEKNVPLRIENLHFNETNMLKINGLTIEIDWYQVEFSLLKKKIYRGDSGSEEEVRKKKWTHYLFNGRSDLYVNKLDYNMNETAEYLTSALADSKFRVNSLNPIVNQYFESALPLIHPDSFPLKTLRTTVIKPETYNHPVVMNAETLILTIDPRNDEANPSRNINNLANKTVIIDEQFNTSRRHNIFALVKCLMTGQKPIGTTYIFLSYYAEIKDILFNMVMAWKRFSDPLGDLEESRFIPDAPRFSIPMDNVEDPRRIIAYGIEAETERGRQRWKVVIKVVSST